MHNYVLSCCSTADLAKEHFESRNISYICFHYFLDGKEYPDDLGQTMPFDQFYQAMVDGADTKTSQVSAGEYIEYFSKFLDEGKDILHLTLSSGISGSYMSACAAQKTLAEKYPDRKIRIVDSLSAASGYGLLIDAMADLRDEGKSLHEVADWAEANRLNLQIWFFSSDLTFFVKGGRVSKTAGAIGGLLGILAAIFLICVAVILNDSIQTEDDIERYLQLPVLAVVPDKSGSSKKSAKRKKAANRNRAAS
jgi:DegV family protein with EDD domain